MEENAVRLSCINLNYQPITRLAEFCAQEDKQKCIEEANFSHECKGIEGINMMSRESDLFKRFGTPSDSEETRLSDRNENIISYEKKLSFNDLNLEFKLTVDNIYSIAVEDYQAEVLNQSTAEKVGRPGLVPFRMDSIMSGARKRKLNTSLA